MSQLKNKLARLASKRYTYCYCMAWHIENMNKYEQISLVLSNNGAFWAFSDKQFDEQKTNGIKYVSMGAGLICPKDNAKKLKTELDECLAEVKRDTKAKIDARAKELKNDYPNLKDYTERTKNFWVKNGHEKEDSFIKAIKRRESLGDKIEMLPKAERIQNRKILISEAISRINNFADDCFIAEHYKMLENSTDKNIIEVIDSLLSAINYRYNDRAFEAEIKETYDNNIEIIKGLKAEIKNIILN